MPRLNANNLSETELAENITDTDTSITVNDASVFPAAPFRATIFDADGNIEIIEASSVSTNTLTVTRGVEGTTAQSYSTGDTVEQRFTAGMFDELSDVTHDHTTASESTVPNAGLSNSDVTIEGNTVSLGGSTSLNHNDLSTISSDDHHTRYTDEEAQDAVGTIMTGSGATSVTYDDAGNLITVSSTDTTDHANLTNVQSSQHHTKTSSASELTDVSADSVSDAHHSQTTSSDIDHDSTIGGTDSDAHHTRYDDSEAQSAVTGSVDAADLTGSSGTSGQVLQTDGSALSFVSQVADSDKVDGQNVFVQDTEPTAESKGDIWIATGGNL